MTFIHSFSLYSIQDFHGRSAAGADSAVSFSDDEDAMPTLSSKPSTRGRKGSSASQTTTRGRGRGRGRRNDSTTLKQTTLDGALGFRSSQRLHLLRNKSF
jgi:double-strand break repair protein MRE11